MALFKVPLMEDESLTSFTSRLANANARSAKELCADFGLAWKHVVAGRDEAITRIADLSGIDRTRLDAAAVKRCGEKTVWVAGEETPFMFYMRGVLKFCPSCFAADEQRVDIKPGCRKYLRRMWHSRFIRTCPLHGQAMVSAGRPENPDHIHDVCWSLDYLRRDVAIASRAAVPQDFTPFEEYVRSRLNSQKPGNDFLDPLPLFVAGDVCELIGLVALHGKKVSVNDKTERQRWEACAKGFEVLASGRDGFHRFLENLARDAVAVRQGCLGGNELFGKFHEILATKKVADPYEPVREAARSYAFANLPLTDTTLLFGNGGNARFVSFNSLVRKYGLSDPIMRKYFKALGADLKMPGAEVEAVPSDEVEQLVATMRDLIRAAEAIRVLGVTVDIFDSLVDDGLVVTAVDRDEAAKFSARYSRKALTEFTDTLLARTTTEDLSGLMSIRAVGKSVHATLVSILRLLLNGSLNRVGIDPAGSGIMSLMLDRDEVFDLLSKEVQATDVRYLTVDDLVTGLRMQATSIYHLINDGRIKTATRAHGVTGYPQRVVTLQAAREFWENHVTLSECGDRLGLHPAKVRKILSAAGVCRIYPRHELREMIFPRSEALAALGASAPVWEEFASGALLRPK